MYNLQVMKNRYIAPTLAVTLALGACSPEGNNTSSPSQEVTASSGADLRIHNTVQVKNIKEVPIQLSNNPNTWSQETNTGNFAAGALATAVCIVEVPNYPESASVYVYSSIPEHVQGYAGVDGASTKEVEGQQQLAPGYDTLAATLPACLPDFKG
jgi:hypothetical protein